MRAAILSRTLALLLAAPLALAVPLALPTPVAAESIEDCDGPNPVVTECIFEKYEAADAELNEVWAEVLETIHPTEFMTAEVAQQWHETLLAAQRAWITYKDEDCQAVAFEWYGGTGVNAAVGSCLYQKTVDRTEDLRERYFNR